MTATPTPPPAAHVRVLTSNQRGTALAFVTFPGQEEVRVRFHRGDGIHQWWKCDECGKHRFSTCRHERAALAPVREQLKAKRDGSAS